MIHVNRNNKNFVSDAFGTLFTASLLMGLSLLALGVLIFVFPQLIGFLVAAFILFAGGAVLYGAWKVWQVKREVKAVQDEWMTQPEFEEIKRRPYTFRRVTWIVR
ncbi:MAG: hypothetical protein G3M70_01140 [Candidatus Nitronauta litoralis]|uniref:Uncharacterized protein n=1 Tax=Candidatus Nitronauta litoralis TaxID=2705533 RepID=A0A7T0BT69_9BACT|nr:MAG: hypothetical protein G3M70_01140 [Candidatus Nitronauta litoralis]